VAVPPPVTVPDVVGVQFAAAQQRMSALGLVLAASVSQESSAVPEGAVLTLNPPAGTSVRSGSTVTAVLAVAPPVIVTVPSLVGRLVSDARSVATAAHLVLGDPVTRPAPGTPADTVLEQQPAAGTSVPAGSVMAVVIASVDTSVLVPDVRSMPEASARVAAANAGLSLVVTGRALSTGTDKVVLSQDPLPNSRVPAGATVNVVLSQSSVQLPSVVGMDVEDAAAQLVDLGLKVQRVVRRIRGGRDGVVLAQSPSARTVVAVGSTVTISFAVDIGPERPPIGRSDP
jgi:serine/threonine-protein kinase